MRHKENYEECVRKDYCRQSHILPVIFFVFFMMISTAQALPGINLETESNSHSFDTLPILGTTTLQHVVNTTYNGSALGTRLDVDFVKGDYPETKWWNENYRYRKPISFTLPSGFDNRFAAVIRLNISGLVNQGRMRSDYGDLRLIENDESIPFIIEDSSEDGYIKIVMRLPDSSRARNMDMYFGNPSSSQFTDTQTESIYRFIDHFTSLFKWNITKGTFANPGEVLTSAINTESMIILNNLSGYYDESSAKTEDKPYAFMYRMRLGVNSSSSFLLSQNPNFSGSKANITFHSDTGNATICIASSCTDHILEIAPDTWYDVLINATGSNIEINLDGDAITEQTYNFDDVYMAFAANNRSYVDDFKIYKRLSTTTTASEDKEQEILRKHSTVTANGIFGWSYGLTGMATDTFYVRTTAEKNNYISNSSVDIINTEYKKIRISVSEEGTVTSIAARHMAMADGSITFRNPNSRNVSLSVDYDTELNLVDFSDEYFTDSTIVFSPLEADSSVKINYYLHGVSTENPVSGINSILGTAIKNAGGLSNYYEFYENSFTTIKDVKKVEVEKDSTGKTIETTRENTFVLEGLTEEYAGLSFQVKKTVSRTRVEPGDIIEVSIKVDNVDVVSRKINLYDRIPDEFVYVEGVNRVIRDKVNLSWNFDINRKSSRLVKYRMMYTGNSTGHKIFEAARLESLIGNITSQNITLFRDVPRSTSAYVQKNIVYIDQDTAKIKITVVNTGDYTLKNLRITEMIGNADVHEESKLSLLPGEWIIRELAPGQIWTLEYVSENHELIENTPQVISEYVNVDTVQNLIIENEEHSILSSESIWKEERSSMLSWIIFIILASELAAMFAYIYRNVTVEDMKGGINKFFVEIAIIWMKFRGRFSKLYERLPAIPKKILLMIKRIGMLAVFAFKHVVIFTRLFFVWLAETVPFLWKIFDKLRKLNPSEKLLFFKMMTDFAKDKIKKMIDSIKKFFNRGIYDNKINVEKIKSSTQKPDTGKNNNPGKGTAETNENNKESSLSEFDVKMQKEAYERYKESQRLIEEMMKDMKK
ncbi:MAG: hypothetical protein ACLFPQ_04305 [Candidatus Woesearchaeota archaeon]